MTRSLFFMMFEFMASLEISKCSEGSLPILTITSFGLDIELVISDLSKILLSLGNSFKEMSTTRPCTDKLSLFAERERGFFCGGINWSRC